MRKKCLQIQLMIILTNTSQKSFYKWSKVYCIGIFLVSYFIGTIGEIILIASSLNWSYVFYFKRKFNRKNCCSTFYIPSRFF